MYTKKLLDIQQVLILNFNSVLVTQTNLNYVRGLRYQSEHTRGG